MRVRRRRIAGCGAVLLCIAAVAFATSAGAASYTTSGYTIWTVAGTDGIECYDTQACGLGGPATSALFFDAQGVAVDAAGDMFITNADELLFVPVASGTYYGQSGMVAGHIYAIVGSQTTECVNNPSVTCGDGGLASNATLFEPGGVTIDHAGDIVIADSGNDTIRFIPIASGSYYGQSMTADHIYTIAGTENVACSDSPCGDTDLATGADLNAPTASPLTPPETSRSPIPATTRSATCRPRRPRTLALR